jgi:hypothetical protein
VIVRIGVLVNEERSVFMLVVWGYSGIKVDFKNESRASDRREKDQALDDWTRVISPLYPRKMAALDDTIWYSEVRCVAKQLAIQKSNQKLIEPLNINSEPERIVHFVSV